MLGLLTTESPALGGGAVGEGLLERRDGSGSTMGYRENDVNDYFCEVCD